MRDTYIKTKNGKYVLAANILFFAGLLLNLVVVLLFKDTVIEPWYFAYFYLGCGAVFYFVPKNIFGLSYGRLEKFVYASVAFGSLLSALLLCVNMFAFKSDKREIEKCLILRRGFTTRSHQPTATVEVDGIMKGFVFPKSQNIDTFTYLQIELRRGILGMNVVENTTLSK
ncbi:MAG: hypothetical protein EOO50_02690 [Flavobacterium sp.]|uniref:hypothetical protein n=1 Tax=Flavobacterium sp. TaxID=239 RepID=UPI001209F69B|nr:hypothetical protein [Flavobacterium sp.]RZJ68346.1 MAG: hypothetical protein EOO50_02690 [Flavobacterium sp.]